MPAEAGNKPERLLLAPVAVASRLGVALDDDLAVVLDDLGRAGFDGYVETYFWTRFGGAMLLSIVNDGVAYGRDQLRSGNGSSATGDNTTSAADTAAADALSNTINIPPVLRKNQGEMVSIFVARDLDFSGVYRLRTSMRRP